MSYSFTVSASKPQAGSPQAEPLFLKPQELFQKLEDSRLALVEDCEEGEDWGEGRFYHFYLEGLSTRGVECGQVEEGLQVRIMACSNEADFQLANRILKTVAPGGARITGEDGDEVEVSEADSLFSKEWCRSQIESGPRVVSAMVKKEQSVLTIPGLLRDAHFGPRMMRELEEGLPENFTERFLEKLREVRYTEVGDYFEASILSAKAPGAEKAMNFAVWGEDVAYLFPKVEFLAIRAGEKDVFFIPREKLDELSPKRPRYIDEVQCFVEPVPSDQWPALVGRAREYRIEKPASPTSPSNSKKWWQFWK